jgi:prephenate dehydratase/chorismate mutase
VNLQKIRSLIDEIDGEILGLLNERMELALQTTKLKDAVLDSEREKQVLDEVARRSRDYNPLVPGEAIRSIYGEIIKASRGIQEDERRLIGFQGEHGAFGELAARRFDPALVTIPCVEFADVFEGVEKGWLDFGIVPVENSIGGAVVDVNALMLQGGLGVTGAVKLRIGHCLLTLPETHYQDIRVVYSHPQALSQCRDFIDRHQIEARPYYDTAGAARMLGKEKPRWTAAIASELCAGLYNLVIVKDRIEDHPFNYTRFLVLAKEPQAVAADMGSIIFSTPHRAGALFAILEIFARAHINLTRIESFPYQDDPSQCAFFLDFRHEDIRNTMEPVLEEVRRRTAAFRFLGFYKEEVCS